ncbi:hypothetical protein OC834_006329 [Tilletia horrida]|nr:hypothetical protein OC834_006329 [Tilletia horrida]
MALNALGIASVVFLVLYAGLFLALLYGFGTAQMKFKSRWSLVLLHVTLRLAAQSVGLAFALRGFAELGLLIAYLVLSAEGYFSLVLCTARFLVSFQIHAMGDSWLEPKMHSKLSLAQRFAANFALSAGARRRVLGAEGAAQTKPNPMVSVHYLLIGANTIIVVGGSLLASAYNQDTGELVDANSFDTGRYMRTAGQAVFLAINLALIGCIVATVRQFRDKAAQNGRRVPVYGHPFLLIILAVSPFLVIRGVFGICQAVIPSLSYYSPETFTPTGLTTEFVVKETVLATAMEWSTCALLCCTWPIVKSHGWGAEQVQEKGSIAGYDGEEEGLRHHPEQQQQQ